MHYLLLVAASTYGLGHPAGFVSFDRRKAAMRLLFISQVVWYWSVTLVKLSVAFLLLRVKPGRRWSLLMRSAMGLIVLAAVVQTIFQFTQCRPFSVYWDPDVVLQGPVT